MKWIFFSVLFLVPDWTKAEVTWPYGIYGLPKAKSGCPTSDGVKWSNGSRFQDMNDNKPHRSEISPKSHMHAEVGFSHRRDITRHFCVKTKFGSLKRNWPKGFYCVYKNSKSTCPHGMTQGWVRWDDEDDDNANRKQGVLPDGQYDDNTILRYCCQEQGQWYNSIELPIDRPFYLLPHYSSSSTLPVCQLVKWALTWLEFIVYDTESNNNGNGYSGSHVFVKNNAGTGNNLLKVYYCYYEGCRYEMIAPYGTFQSPKSEFSAVYPTFQYCSWLITVSATYVVLLNFTSFYVPNCDNNFVKIYDGVNDSAPILATYCGLNATSESKIISSTNNVYVKANFGSYSSKNSRISSNFQAEYSAQLNPTGCHYEITGNKGSFTSAMHFIPDDYPMFQYCSWLVTVNALFVVSLNVTYLKVSNCNESFVKIYDGFNDIAPALATLCDSMNLPSERNISIISSTNNVYLVLKYESNPKNLRVRPEFRINYNTQLKPTARTTAKMETTSNHSLPNTLANQNKKSSSVIYIIIAVLIVIVIIILAVVIAIIYWRRRRKQIETESTILRGLNPVYDIKKIATVNPHDSNCYATPTVPQEHLWVGGSTICKESRNPIYEHAGDEAEPSTLYLSADNVTYEPMIEQKKESENPMYGDSDVSAPPVYTDPTARLY